MKHKFIESHRHRFSKCYHEKVDTEAIYVETTKELLLHAMRGGKSVCMMLVCMETPSIMRYSLIL
jgi:hypothetical protein